MHFEDLYAQLSPDRDPLDQHEHDSIPQAPDEVVYRLGYASVPIAGIPDQCRVGRVEIHRAIGPILTQQTTLRQRHGLPVVFDKSLQLGVEIGRNEVLTICQIRDEPPSDFTATSADWREEATTALGILAAALDERVAIEERFEDIINLRGGQPISSADIRRRLRTFLPFDVTGEERATLNGLEQLRVDELLPLTQAARWYLQAAQAGPTADSIVYLWIAIESLTPHRTTSPKMVEAMMTSAGFLPEWLGDLTVGRLAGLRADIVHGGTRDHPLIQEGYYRLEAVVRVLLRNAAGVRSSWAPVLTAGVFGPKAAHVSESQMNRQTVWHDGGLPPPPFPKPAKLEWDRIQVPMAMDSPPMDIMYLGELQPGWKERSDHWLARAAELLELDIEPIHFEVARIDACNQEAPRMRVNQNGLHIDPELFRLPDPNRELELAGLIHEGLAQVMVMRLGIDSVSFGTTLIAVGGSWARYRAFYDEEGPFRDKDLEIGELTLDDLNQVGVALGAAAAGSAVAAKRLSEPVVGDDDEAQFIGVLTDIFRSFERFPALLSRIREVAEGFEDFPSLRED